MIYSVNFLDLAEQVSPLAFSEYLKNTGWTSFQSKRKDVKIYQLSESGEFFQVTIPLDMNLSDYSQAMLEAVNTVAEAEGKSVEETMLYLLNPNTDILKIKLDKKGVEAGNILFDDAIRLYENAKRLLSAAALDILHPQKYHQGRVDDAVTKFLSDCRFGQTEIGSYVVSVVCPFAELDEDTGYRQLTPFSDEEQCANSLTRQVTNRVMNSISNIKNQIDSGNMDELYTEKGRDMISANFYEALVGLSLDSEGTNLEFTAEWSPAVKNNSPAESRITLSHYYYQPMSNVITKLKEKQNKSSKIIGRITKLESSADISKRTTGKITLKYQDENNKIKTVTSLLEKNDYNRAIEAHARGNYVEIIGELTGGHSAAINCESFSVID